MPTQMQTMWERSRDWARRCINNRIFEWAIIAVIMLNCFTLAVETYHIAVLAPTLAVLDQVFLSIFVAELGLRFFAHGRAQFRNPWFLFDLAIVLISLAPASHGYTALRALRVLRVLRIISAFPRLRRIIIGLFHAAPSMLPVIFLLLLIFFIGSVMATQLYGQEFPEWFGTLGKSAYSLFQIMTLESWSMGIVRPVMAAHPSAWVFFVAFILITNFTTLNLFLAIIVDGIQHAQQADKPDEASETEKLADMIRQQQAQIAQLQQTIEQLLPKK